MLNLTHLEKKKVKFNYIYVSDEHHTYMCARYKDEKSERETNTIHT